MMVELASQSTGVERLAEVAAAAGGVRVAVRDRRLGIVLAVVTVPADAIMRLLSEQHAGPQAVPGEADGAALDVLTVVRQNEVRLAVGGADAAVGLDDRMDALGASAT